MQEARFIIEMAMPYISYIVPALFIFSVLSFADVIISFLYKIFTTLKNRVRF